MIEVKVIVGDGAEAAQSAAALRRAADMLDAISAAPAAAAPAPLKPQAPAAPKPQATPAPKAASPAGNPQGGTAAATPAKRGPGRPPKAAPPPPPEVEPEAEDAATEGEGDDDIFGAGEATNGDASLTLEGDIIPAFKDYNDKHGRAKVAAVLDKFGVKSVRHLKESDFAAVMKIISK